MHRCPFKIYSIFLNYYARCIGTSQLIQICFITPTCFPFPFSQGDVLRNNLLVRYFGKSFIQKPENVEIGVSHTAPITHGPGGIKKILEN